MQSRLVDRDSDAGIATWHHFDPMTLECTVETVQDVSTLIACNKAVYASVDERQHWRDGQGDRVASIPLSVFYDPKVGIQHDRVQLRKWLNNPDNRFFRTRPGTI